MSGTGAVRLLVCVVFVGILELLCRVGAINALVLIPPSEMVVSLYRLFVSGAAMPPLVVTMSNVAAAVALSVVVGLTVGIVVHGFPRLRKVLDPLFASYYAIPVFVFYPLLVAIFGLNNWPLILIAFAFAAVAMVINTLNGLDRVPRILLKMSRVLNMNAVQRVFYVTVPAAMPNILTGVKLSVAYSFLGVIAGEFILSDAGLGFEIAYAYDMFDNQRMYALMLLVLIMSVIVNTVLAFAEGRIATYRKRGRA